MKRTNYLWIVLAAVAFSVACNKVDYKKTKSGLLYKIISSGGKDSTARDGDWIKFNVVQKINDSVMQTTFGKMPVYQQYSSKQAMDYNPGEIFGMLKKGDSAVAVILIDTLLKRGLVQENSLPPFMKKGDRIVVGFKVLDIFRNDSLYRNDYEVELAKDRPRQEKEQAEMMAKEKKAREEAMRKEDEELEKSGEKARELKALETYFKERNITAQKTGAGTFIVINQHGNGPAADSGKFVTVNFTGRILETDSIFQTSQFTMPLRQGELIGGIEDGLMEMRQGDKGTIYIAGFRAYGKNPRPGSPFRPYESLKFDVDIVAVSDTMPQQQAGPQLRGGRRN